MDIEPLTTELVERYLDTHDLKFFRGRDGNEFLLLMSDEKSRLHVHIRISGPDRNLLTIQVSPVQNYAAGERARLMELVNDWNRDAYWPKAFVRETSGPSQVGVVGESCYPLKYGVHFEALGRFIDYTVNAAFELFERIGDAIQLPSAGTLQAWWGQAG
ncbi:YbjN domain-containing protein [Mycobacterium sp.]|uniref:YbjN domain-containing protein n=1 Tax=Mycobacterium sp. TaxID=1785 RepID=UPI002C900E19|nr:YbjN domain-containing protein [Mycobacterium sp.]HTQ17101.1 YbjN domain-containing protein [Mycobacterium sp.]